MADDPPPQPPRESIELLLAIADGHPGYDLTVSAELHAARGDRLPRLPIELAFGSLAGQIELADDFDDPLPEFEPYM